MLTKQESIQLKGIAILVMIWLHTFHLPLGTNYHVLCYFNDESLAFQIGKITSICISLYAFLGGYGLYINYLNISGGNLSSLRQNLRRVFLLYLNFWFVFTFALVLGCFLKPMIYPGSLKEFIYNFMGWNTSYCKEWWFLLPYSVLVILSGTIAQGVKRFHWFIVLLITALGYFFANATLHYYPMAYEFPHISNPLLSASLMFSFVLGMVAAKYKIRFCISLKKVTLLLGLRYKYQLWFKRVSFIALLLVLIFIRMYIPTGIFNPIFMLLFVFIVYNIIYVFNNHSNVLQMLGRQSMNMWLVHPFFCYYFFSDFIYSFKYAPLIFIAMVICSYVVSVILDYLYQPLRTRVVKILFS